MHTFVIPGWVWINLALLVAAAIVVGVKLAAAEKTARQRPEPASPTSGRALK